MVDDRRIHDLQIDRDGWKSRLDSLVLQRAKLLDDQCKGYRYLDASGVDQLPFRLREVDCAVVEHQEGLINAQALLERGRNGEDV